MKLLIDMNLSHRLCPMLADAGHEARHWSEIGDPRADDRELLAWAKQKGFVLVTHDLDFGAILAATGFDSPSVVQIRRRDILPESLIAVLARTLSQYRAELEDGALIVVDELNHGCGFYRLMPESCRKVRRGWRAFFLNRETGSQGEPQPQFYRAGATETINARPEGGRASMGCVD